jgi:hypothetical protein
MKKILVLYFLLLGNCLLSFSQTLSISPKLGHNFFQPMGSFMVDKWAVIPSESAEEGSTIGASIRLDFKKFYLQSGLQYTSNAYNEGYYNTNPVKYPLRVYDPQTQTYGEIGGYWPEWTVIGGPIKFHRIEVPILLGLNIWRPIKKITLRTNIGILPAYRFIYNQDFGYRNLVNDIYAYPQVRQYLAVESAINNQYQFNLDYMLGGGLDIGNFTIDCNYVRSITNLSGKAEFEGKSYRAIRKSAQLMFSFGYKIRLSKKIN